MDVPACLRRGLGVLLPVALSACGGGVFIGFGFGGDGEPPSVSLAATQTSVLPGTTLHVVAAASDPDGIDEVAFYRLDGNAAVRLGSDGSQPYQWDVLVPNDGRSTLQLFARATDASGDRADSNVVTVTVTP